MEASKTLIVLGAGASSHYGFPTGGELIDDIIKLSNSPYFESIMNEEYSFSDAPKIKRFNKLIRDFDPLSVDRFLTMYRTKRDVVDIGKKLITHSIISKQKHESFTRLNKENWYKYLYDFIFSDEENFIKKIENDSFRIITFNYDLSLESFFHFRLENNPNYNKAEAWELFSNFNKKIKHVYGSVYNYETIIDDIPLTGFDSKYRYEAHRKWADKANHYYFNETKEFSNQIKIIGDERESFIGSEWGDYIQSAEKIYILGFGFDKINTKILGLNKITMPHHKKVYCTNFNGYKVIEDKIDRIFNGVYWTKYISHKNVFNALIQDFTF